MIRSMNKSVLIPGSVIRCAGFLRGVRVWSAFVPLALGVMLAPAADSPSATPVATPEAERTAQAGSGISYRNEKIAEGPLSVHIVRVDRSRSDLSLGTTLGRGSVLDLSVLSDQVKALQIPGMKPVVAINGDFFRTDREAYAGDPLGFQVMQGELVSSGYTNRPSFWIDAQGRPQIGLVESVFEVTLPGGAKFPFQINEERVRGSVRLYTPRLGASTKTSGGREILLEADGAEAWLPLRPGQSYRCRVKDFRNDGNTPLPAGIAVLSVDPSLLSGFPVVKRGDVIQLSTRTVPDTAGASVAIGGGPTLVRGGKLGAYVGRNDRHPRSAIGWNDTHWIFVEVDGRQSNLSVGMTLPELAEYMRKLGATEAMNLDGGGSATLWLYGQVVNSPCYGHERSTANGLVVLRKDPPQRESD